MKLFRCSSLHKLTPTPRTKGEVLSQTAKEHIRELVKQDVFNFYAFLGNKYTQKGVLLEEVAINNSGLIREKSYKKHSGRLENQYITGECDVLDKDDSLIIDTKCTWDIGSHPFSQEEAWEKVKKAGYDWQMQGYMWLYDCKQAEIDFWLFPCPAELLSQYDDKDQLIYRVEEIPLQLRHTTVHIDRDEKMIARIEEVVPTCQQYYQTLRAEIEAKMPVNTWDEQEEELVVP